MIPTPSPEQLRWIVDHNAQIRAGHRAQIITSADAWAAERVERNRLRAALTDAQAEVAALSAPKIRTPEDIEATMALIAETERLRAEAKSLRYAFNAHLAVCPMSKAPGGIGG